MRRKIHITDHGVVPAEEDNQEAEIVPTGDPATDPMGERVGSEEPRADQGAEEERPTASTLEAKAADLENQLHAEQDNYRRLLADFQNFRRRNEDEKRKFAQFANEDLVRSLLPVLDNFERALAAAEKNQSYESLVSGVTLTHRQLLDILRKFGVEPIETEGQTFDPNFHDAVERVADSDAPENSIVQELQRGYTMHTRMLRPSLVKVAGG
jgi:molecular chaperone GrpE